VVRNRMKISWERSTPVFGGWCLSGSPFVSELLALQGFDYVCLDAQHGLLGIESTVSCLFSLARTECTPIVRVPANDVSWIGKVIDSGAQGVIIPMVETREQAELAVANTRIYPQGHRSYGPLRISQVFGTDPDELNREIICMVMIETELGVKNADEICSVPGIDGVYVGPLDLSVTLGIAPTLQLSPGPVADAVETIRKACFNSGVVAGIQCGSGESAAMMADQGFKMITVGTDALFLRAAGQLELSKARGEH
jgi:4-hydroxy-2-oxoheptanedioate aldolase